MEKIGGLAMAVIIFTLAWCSTQSTMDHGNVMNNNTDSQSMISIQEDKDTISAKSSEIVILKDGDTYEMTVTKVIKEIWNAKIPMLAYNWSIPWPLLKVEKWATVTIKFTNNVEEIETLLHSHGVRLDNTMDGVSRAMWWHQDPIKYWETFEYKLTFPDEGIFRYHPHVQEELQQELGLYGNYLVNDASQAILPVNREETLILDDILLENEKLPAFLKNWVNYSLMGRYGNVMLINGTPHYKLMLKQWEVVRFYITNVSNTRPYNLTIPGAKIKLVGGDIWAYEYEELITNLIIWPAERYIVDVMIDKVGIYTITNQIPGKSITLGTIVVSDEMINKSYVSDYLVLKTNTGVIADINEFRSMIDAPVDKVLHMSIDMGMMKGMSHMMWARDDGNSIEREDDMGMMNKQSDWSVTKRKLIDDETKKENMDINWSFKKGDKLKIRITNDQNSMHPMQHPIHFHWQRFLVVSKNSIEQTNLVWKDTVLIPSWEYVDIVLDASNSGSRMAHCHIAEHLSAGMMMKFDVK